MTEMKILAERDLKTLVALDAEAVACVENAFHALATKSVVMPPSSRI